ncbi:MAG: hypothetical protein J6A08_13600 [Lachnospiraceae bacterium]|nr:hypothetical protein [Lachnospiraceae bacterium]
MYEGNKQAETPQAKEKSSRKKGCYEKRLVNNKLDFNMTKKHINSSMEASDEKEFDIALMTGKHGKGGN